MVLHSSFKTSYDSVTTPSHEGLECVEVYGIRSEKGGGSK